MKKRKLGVDIDGCLNYLQESLWEIIKRDYGVEVPLHEWDALKHINITTNDEINAFWDKYNPELFDYVKSNLQAVEIVNLLYKKGVEIDIITARDYNVAALTKEWLERENIKYDSICFHAGNKLNDCNWKHVEIMVEDNADNALILAQNGITVLLYDRPYNQEIEHEKIVRVFNWMEIYKYLQLTWDFK